MTPLEQYQALVEPEPTEHMGLATAMYERARQQDRIQRRDAIIRLLVGQLREANRAYVNLLEAGRDRIIDYGGTCDPVDVMERNDPWLTKSRALLSEVQQEFGT